MTGKLLIQKKIQFGWAFQKTDWAKLEPKFGKILCWVFLIKSSWSRFLSETFNRNHNSHFNSYYNFQCALVSLIWTFINTIFWPCNQVFFIHFIIHFYWFKMNLSVSNVLQVAVWTFQSHERHHQASSLFLCSYLVVHVAHYLLPCKLKFHWTLSHCQAIWLLSFLANDRIYCHESHWKYFG